VGFVIDHENADLEAPWICLMGSNLDTFWSDFYISATVQGEISRFVSWYPWFAYDSIIMLVLFLLPFFTLLIVY